MANEVKTQLKKGWSKSSIENGYLNLSIGNIEVQKYKFPNLYLQQFVITKYKVSFKQEYYGHAINVYSAFYYDRVCSLLDKMYSLVTNYEMDSANLGSRFVKDFSKLNSAGKVTLGFLTGYAPLETMNEFHKYFKIMHPVFGYQPKLDYKELSANKKN